MKKILIVAFIICMATGVFAANRVDFTFIIPNSDGTVYNGYALLTENGSNSNFRMVFEAPSGTKALLVGQGDSYKYRDHYALDAETKASEMYGFLQPGGGQCVVMNMTVYDAYNCLVVTRINPDGSQPFEFRIMPYDNNLDAIYNLIKRAVRECNLKRVK